jgi:hypothetical protein
VEEEQNQMDMELTEDLEVVELKDLIYQIRG